MNKQYDKTGIQRIGYIPSKIHPITYQIGERPVAGDTDGSSWKGEDSSIDTLTALAIENYFVWPNGANNDDPSVCKELIKGNRLFPSLIEKQIAILYGHGIRLYREVVKDDGTVGRIYVKDREIQDWMDSWRESGLPDDIRTYIIKNIRAYYYSESIFTKWHLSAAAGVDIPAWVGKKPLPVAGLEHISETRARFCTRRNLSQRRDVVNADFDKVMVGNWAADAIRHEYRVYPRMDYTDPLKRNSVISYSRNPNYGEEVYATNVFFAGIKEWIRGTNATPAYINSFLQNSLSARHHVIIPNAWMAEKERAIQEMCEANSELQADGKPLKKITLGKGDSWTIEVGTVYSPELLEKYVQLELRKLTEFLSGRGKNQGKIYATRSFFNDSGKEEVWKIEEITQKYQEYIKALIEYDKRADNVLLAAKGIDASISNISSDGVFSKSGSESYYNYAIYLTQQTIPEEVVCADLNYAIRLNWPEKYASGIRVGFYRPTVAKQEDTAPEDRLINQEEQ